MKMMPLAITDVLLIEPTVFEDERGFFFESFNQLKFESLTQIKTNFVQDNHSRSKRNTLRGLHYQVAPKAQGKLVRVIEGEVFDVAVDLRKSSPTFGCWVGEILSATNRKQLWIPEGFAHGFLVLSDTAECLYKTTDYYSIQHERFISWNDPDINIRWPLSDNPILSAKDSIPSSLINAEVFI